MAALVAAACSGGSHAVRRAATTTAARAVSGTTAPTPTQEVQQCQRFGVTHALDYLGIDGLAAGSTAKTIAAELSSRHLTVAPWDSVDPVELVYAWSVSRAANA